MGINLGAFIAPLVCGYLGQRDQLALGLRRGRRRHGARPDSVRARAASTSATPACIRRPRNRLTAARALRRSALDRGHRRCSALLVGVRRRRLHRRARRSRRRRSPTPPAYVPADRDRRVLRLAVSRAGDWTPAERKRLYAIGVLFLAAALFWSVFEQAGSTLNLFADRNTRTTFLGWSSRAAGSSR